MPGRRSCATTPRPRAFTIYTVHVNTGSPPDPTSAVLQYCASSPENFFLVTAASQNVAAFKSIGASLSKLRVAR
jgi:hypothetical protein